MSLKHIAAAALAAALIAAPTLAFSQQSRFGQLATKLAPPVPGARYDPGRAADKRPDPKRFDKQVAAFLEADKTSPPGKCDILFIGSASIASWNTINEDLAPDPVIGRGLSLSTFEDWNHYFDKLVAPYKPRAIFMYVGENEIVNGLTPRETIADFTKFMDLKTKVLGATPVYFISIRNTPARLPWAADQQKENEMVVALSKKRSDLTYIDVTHDTWVDGKLFGQIKEDFYDANGLHVSPKGRLAWTQVIKPFVDKEAARQNACK